jgi:hypothetical protein
MSRQHSDETERDTEHMSTEIVLTKVNRNDNRMGGLSILASGLLLDVPANVPADATSWFEATLWERTGAGGEDGKPVIRTVTTGWTEREAIQEMFVRLNQSVIDAMLKGARYE